MPRIRHIPSRGRGMTLLELITGLTVLSILSIAGFTLLAGSLNTDRYLRAAHTAESEVELAIRRMTHNLRTASAMSTPTTTTATNTFTTTTQGDPANANAGYTVTYRLSNGQLIENDSRYAASGTSDHVLCTNVTAFSVQLLSATSPKTVQITLTVGGPQAVTRTFRVTPRNL